MKRLALALIPALLPSVAFAHVGLGDAHDLTHGIAHPFSGLDHILAMVAVGLFAAHLGGRALWLVPLSFITLMIAGGVAGAAGVPLPYTETGIALSVVVLGLAVAFRLNMPTIAAMALAGFFAIFHGHAHGAEMPESVQGLTYGIGFVVATAALHGIGIALGLGINHLSETYHRRIAQVGGGAMALVGLLLASHVI
ncbi:MAG: HupE/UreJ family protein [Pseudorhodoplanes sp.]